MKKSVVLLTLSIIAMLSLSININSKSIAEEELPRPTAIKNLI